MKKYHVYGIGNALVDMEFEVSADFLRQMKIAKGQMTLVDEQRQMELVGALHGTQHKRCCGGSAANSMIALSQLGGKSFYSCKVASDETGDFYYQDLLNNGTETNLHRHRSAGTSGKCLVFVTPDADRTMNTFLGITGSFSKEEIIEEELAKAQYLYIEGYLAASPLGKEAAKFALQLAHRHKVKTALTFSDVSMVTYFKDNIVEMMGPEWGPLDFLFCNEAEAYAFTGTEDMGQAVIILKKYAKSFAITRGPKGALIYTGEKEIDVLTPKVEAVDTNGAGDLFAGAFLYCLTHGHSYSEAGQLACSLASKLVTQFGARLKKEQTLEIKKLILS